MKLLHIAPIGHHSEGIGSVLKDLVPHQISSGHDVRIISVFENKIYSGLPITTIIERKKFIQYIDIWNPDFVLFHSLYRKQFLEMYKILLKRRIPYGIQMHGGLSVENYRKNLFKKLVANILFFNRFIKNAKTIVYLSEAEYERCIVKRLNSSKTIVPNGTTVQEMDIAKPLPVTKLEIIFIGRISMQVKGLDKLLQAIKIMKRRDDVHFSIYGNEDDIHTSLLKEEIADLNGFVDYCGGLYGKEKDSVMRKANIFILTSPSEGMPMGVLDALSYGMPCIVTPGTNMAHVIRDNNAGWVAQYDSHDIARVIDVAIKEYTADQNQYRINAHKVSELYAWESVARQSIESIMRIIS